MSDLVALLLREAARAHPELIPRREDAVPWRLLTVVVERLGELAAAGDREALGELCRFARPMFVPIARRVLAARPDLGARPADDLEAMLELLSIVALEVLVEEPPNQEVVR